MNQQDLNAMTEFWHRETNHLNDSIDSAFKSAQDDAYARGYRRGREDLIDIRKQRDELLAALTKAREDINWMLNNEQFLNGFVFDYIDAAIDSVKGDAA